MSEAADITRRAKSNLAFAFACVSKKRRADLNIFYAFCRVVDDIADDENKPVAEKQAGLNAWMDALDRTDNPAGSLEAEVVDMRDRHQIDPDLFKEIIRGCESDLVPQRFGTWDDLEKYCYRVASAVGLITVPLFGASDKARDYAVALGNALQLTNILRDVGEDLSNGCRIYLPLADLHRFQYTERDLLGRVHDDRFLALMNFEADRAEKLHQTCADLLPRGDRRAMGATEVMRKIYHALLTRMRKDNYRVFDRRYRISKSHRISILLRQMICR
jgi:phytoene synthase